MFYGTINPPATGDGPFAPSGTFSNNFTAARKNGGTVNNSGIYFITYGEYTACKPTSVATPLWPSTGQSAGLVQWYTSGSDSPQITTIEIGATATDNPIPFSFYAQTGQRLVFDASMNTTLSLTPKIVSFNGGSVLALTTDIKGLDASAQPGAPCTSSFTASLDKGSALLGVYRSGGTMTLSIPKTVEDASNTTWNLTGWTFGGSGEEAGTEWDVGDTTNTYALSVPTSGGAPMTTPETFVIMATNDDGQTLTSDPLVRLSRVPPAGLSM